MSKKMKTLRNTSLESLEERESTNLIESIEADRALSFEASQDAVSAFKEAGDKKDNAQGLLAGAIFNLFKFNNYNQEISANILKHQLDGNKGSVSTSCQELYEKLGLIKADKPDTTLDEQYKEFNKANKGFQAVLSDGNKLALAAWQHGHNTMELCKTGTGQLLVKIRQDFYTDDKVAAGDNVAVIGRKKRSGYKPFTELMTEAKKKLGIVAEKNPKSAGGTGAETKPLTLQDIVAAMKSFKINKESFDAKELEMISEIEKACVQIQVDNAPFISGRAAA